MTRSYEQNSKIVLNPALVCVGYGYWFTMIEIIGGNYNKRKILTFNVEVVGIANRFPSGI